MVRLAGLSVLRASATNGRGMPLLSARRLALSWPSPNRRGHAEPLRPLGHFGGCVGVNAGLEFRQGPALRISAPRCCRDGGMAGTRIIRAFECQTAGSISLRRHGTDAVVEAALSISPAYGREEARHELDGTMNPPGRLA